MEKKDQAPMGKGTLDGRYVVLSDLGSGGNADVKLAFDLQGQQRVAVKIMKKLDASVEAEVAQEANTMGSINHPNVLRVIDARQGQYESSDGSKKYAAYYMALELAQEESLFDYIVSGQAFPEPVAAYLFYQFLRGLHAIHEKGLCHRDIKCENLLLADNFYLKVADFGYAQKVKGKYLGKHAQLFSIVGTPGQIAPEIEELHRQIKAQDVPADAGYRGDLVDMFNAGIVLFCMIFQRFPFGQATSNDRVYKYAVADNAENFWKRHKADGLDVDGASEEVKKLIYALLYAEPELRISISEALSFPWFQTQAQKMTVDQIIDELKNRKAYMQLLKEEEAKAAESTKSSNVRGPARGPVKAGGGIPRTLYAKNDFSRTSFPVKGDPYFVFGRINAILTSYLQAVVQPSKKGKFKLKLEKSEDQPVDESPAEDAPQVPEAERPQRQVAFAVKIMAANEADLGAAVKEPEEEKEGEGEEPESKDLYVGFQRDADSDYARFMECYEHVKKELLSSASQNVQADQD